MVPTVNAPMIVIGQNLLSSGIKQKPLIRQGYAMTEITASMVRNIICSSLKINPRQVKLEGEISPNMHFEAVFHDGSLGSNYEKVRLWGFDPLIGMKELSDHIGEASGSNYAHSKSVFREGKPLHEIEEVEKFSFFVLNKEGEHNWEGSTHEKWNRWSIFKAPNFQQHREQLEKADLRRWEEWYAS